jgi:hypothetical protein
MRIVRSLNTRAKIPCGLPTLKNIVNLNQDFVVCMHSDFLQGKTDWANPENTNGGSITIPLTSCLTGLESAV